MSGKESCEGKDSSSCMLQQVNVMEVVSESIENTPVKGNDVTCSCVIKQTLQPDFGKC